MVVKMAKWRMQPGRQSRSIHNYYATMDSGSPHKRWLVALGVTLAVVNLFGGFDLQGSQDFVALMLDPSVSNSTSEQMEPEDSQVKRILFHEIPAEEFRPSKLKHDKILYTTSFFEATVLTKSPEIKPRKICQASCCAETVSISLEQDDHHIINTVDGPDLADVLYKNHPQPGYLEFFASELTEEILPCLQPGTIIHLTTSGDLSGFFETIRPKITVPYILITSETDLDSPIARTARLETDNLLLQWYGSNPLARNLPNSVAAKQKFTAFPLGLSKWHDQSRLLTRYLELRNFTNPFSGDQKKRWTEATALRNLNLSATAGLDQVAIDNLFYDTALLKFGINPELPPVYKKRQSMFETLCDKIHANARRDNVTCSMAGYNVGNPGILRTDIVYNAASQYLFGLSPEGAGWDCYRTYELLLLGVIPIVAARGGGSHGVFDDLPVIELEMLHQKNRTRAEYLQIMQDYVQSPKFLNTDFETAWERLFLRYWRRHVLKMANRDGDIWTDAYGREFYQAWKYTSKSSKK